MLKITKGNAITLTRGDTMTLTLSLLDMGGNQYVPEEGDSIRFAIAVGYTHDAHYELQYETTIPTESLQFTVPASVTKDLPSAEYNYDVELTHADGAIDTVISGKLKLVGEVK